MGDEQQAASAAQVAGTARELVARVIASRLFKRSSRQRELLEYLAEQALAVPPRETHEQQIGVAVFGRPAEYDTSQDNIVRVHVSELRKRLEEYFKSEGAAENQVLEIPRGAYTLVISPRVGAPEAKPQLVEAPDPPAFVAPQRRSRLTLALGVACVLLAGACTWLLARNAALERAAGPPVVANLLWRQFFSNGRDTDLIVADSCLSLFTDMVNAPVGLQDYLNRSYLLGNIATERDAARRRDLELLMSRRYTSMADALSVQRITRMSTLDHKSLSIYFARDYPSQRLRTMNVILLGSKRSNPWVEAFEDRMNFRMEYDAVTGDNRVVNLHPRPGETASYTLPGLTNDPRESLAIIAYVPNAEGNGAAVILAGSGLQGTTAAGEAFVSSGFQQIADVLPKRTDGRLPYFEVLLRASAVGATVRNFSVVASRVIEQNPNRP